MTSLPITLSPGFTPLVKEGDTVTKGQVLAEKTVSDTVDVNLSELLNVPVQKIKRTLKKNPGDSVEEGDILAEKKGLFGVSQTQVKSQGTGIVSGYERSTGVLSVLKQNDSTSSSVSGDTVISPIDGTVSICNNEQIVLETDKNIISGTNGVGKSAEGELFSFFSGTEGDEVKPHALTTEIIGKVVLGGSFSRESLLKAIGMDAAAVIGFAIADADLEHIVKHNITTPVLVIPEEQKKTLLKWVGKTVFVDGGTKSILLLKIEK